jgi:hypothetical protein
MFAYKYCGQLRQTTGFARMPDAGQIAFSVVGSGQAVVLPAGLVSHVAEVGAAGLEPTTSAV